MFADQSKFVVKTKNKGKAFEILDEAGKVLAKAKDTTPFLPGLFGSATIEVRDSGNSLLFSITRSGWLFKKDHVVDGKGEIVGQYKSKMFSLSGGFHMYDKEGQHVGEIQGKMFSAEYKFLTPDQQTEMGSVSRTWGGMAKSLFTGNDTYGVQIGDKYTTDARAKMLILGATIAVESIFKKKAGKKGSGGGDDGGGGGGDE